MKYMSGLFWWVVDLVFYSHVCGHFEKHLLAWWNAGIFCGQKRKEKEKMCYNDFILFLKKIFNRKEKESTTEARLLAPVL